jgi:hypothetical protein
MRIDPEDLRRHYAMLPDEALLDIDRAELTDLARTVYDQELNQRGLRLGQKLESAEMEGDDAGPVYQPGEIGEAEDEADIDAGPEPDWLEDAACACAFTMYSANNDVPTAATARAVLRANGIPCHITMTREAPPKVEAAPQSSLRVMVPGSLALHAASVLDQHIFNEEHEAEWRNNLEVLSDKELRELNPEIFCAGLLDRVARLRAAYQEEISRRKLTPRR